MYETHFCKMDFQMTERESERAQVETSLSICGRFKNDLNRVCHYGSWVSKAKEKVPAMVS